MEDEAMERAINTVLAVFPGAEVVMTKRPCKLCNAPLVFVKGPKGKQMVFDEKPKTSWYIDEESNEARPFKSYVPHWATCPNAEDFRRKKKGGGNG